MDYNFINYRLRYESFARFATAVNKASNIQEVLENLLVYYKYIINANFLRLKYDANIEEEHGFTCTIYQGQQKSDFLGKSPFSSSESWYFENFLPEEYDQPDDLVKEYPRLAKAYYHPISNMEESRLLFIVGLTEEKKLDESDHFFIKLVGNYLENKFYQLVIYNSLHKQHDKLKNAYDQIEGKNRKIQDLVNSQEKIIQQRTKDLEQRNEQLVDYAFMNHHEIRGPVSSLKGLVDLIATEEHVPESLQVYIEKLKVAMDQVDSAIQKAGKVLDEHKESHQQSDNQ